MKVKIEIKNKPIPIHIAEKVLFTKIVGSFYIIYLDRGKYIYPMYNIKEIKEIYEDEDEKTKVLSEDIIEI